MIPCSVVALFASANTLFASANTHLSTRAECCAGGCFKGIMFVCWNMKIEAQKENSVSMCVTCIHVLLMYWCEFHNELRVLSAPLYVHVTHTQHTHTHRLVICSWPLPFLVLCLVLFCTFVYVRMYVPVCNLWSGLFPFSELVCNLLPRRLFDGFRQRCIARRVCQSQFWRAMLGRTLGSFDAFQVPTLVGEHHWSLGATFLGS